MLLQPLIQLGQRLLHRVGDWTKPITAAPLVGALTDVRRSRRELILENALLRQQLLVLQRQTKRPRLHGLDRAVIVGLASRVTTETSRRTPSAAQGTGGPPATHGG
jgi:hypothetical protein